MRHLASWSECRAFFANNVRILLSHSFVVELFGCFPGSNKGIEAIGCESKSRLVRRVAMIHQCQISEGSAGKFKALREEFYADSPERLKAAHFGLTLTVKKTGSDSEQD